MAETNTWLDNPDAAVAAAVASVAAGLAIPEPKKKQTRSKKTSTSLPTSAVAQGNFVDQEVQACNSAPSPANPSARGKATNPFKDALDFVSVAQNAKGLPHEYHVRIFNNFIYSTDGVLTVGHPIPVGANFNPKLEDLKKILTKFPRDFSITVDQDNSATFVCGDFRTVLSCLIDPNFPPLEPDGFVWGPLNNTMILDGLKQLDPMIVAKGEYVAQSCIRMKTNVMEAASKRAVQQFWHGWTLPYETSVPKQAVRAVLKCGKELASIGYGESTITFFFTDGSWIKSQIYKEPYPEIETVFQAAPPAAPIPLTFFKALDTIEPWTIEGVVFVRQGLLSTWPHDDDGTSMKVPGLDPNISLIMDYPSLHLADSDLYKYYSMSEEGCFFSGDWVRLAIRPTPVNEINI